MATIRKKHKGPLSWYQKDPGPWSHLLINWLATLAVIMVFGLVMLFSASYTTGYLRMGSSFHYISRQLLYAAVGLGLMWFMSHVDHRALRRLAGPGYWVVLALLAVTLTMAPLNGCKRWLRFGGFTIQTSEVAKFEMILLCSGIAAKAQQFERLDSDRLLIKPTFRQWLKVRVWQQLVKPVAPLVPVLGLLALEPQLFADLLNPISAQIVRIQRTASAVAQLDVLASFAEAALQNNYVLPTVDTGDVFEIKEGRHPVIEKMLKNGLFVPNDTLLDEDENRMLLITGPNMAGKSTYMRQNALIALMAQIGSFVPAASAHIGVVDAIFTRVGASDDLAAGQSTFMVEMTEVAEILRSAGKDSLVILDEIGRGTSTFDGMSIARAVVEYICENIGCKTLFATHYHELTSMDKDLHGVKNYNIAVKKRGEDITFLRRIVAGPADDSYGIEVAKLAGLPGSVTRRAHTVLRQLEAAAPGRDNVMQLDFETVEAYNNPSVPSEVMDKLHSVDIETLTPLEALNFLYELKTALDKD